MTTHATTHEKPAAESRAHSKVGDVLTLAKLRVNALVVATTAGGYYLAGPQETNLSLLGWTCLGTTLVASGAAAINQVHERDTDRLMHRTKQRPVAAGRMGAGEGLVISGVLSIAGLSTLWLTSNAAATLVALATFVSYAGLYTPLKRRTSLSTMVGAVPGALPPLIGWAAVRGTVAGIEPWSLFLIGFMWQLPHVLAISWMYREDYARAGIPVLPVVDTHGAVTGRQTVLWAATLIPCSQLPYLFGLTNAAYAIGALILGVAQLVLAIAFLRHRSVSNARALFYGSIVYLPALWLLMVAGRQ